MCLSAAYREKDHTLLMDNTSRIDIDGDVVRLQDLFGEVLEIQGTLVSTDLEKNVIVIRCD